MPTTRVAYPRATEARDAEGNLLFRSHAIWVLMDSNTRAMVLPGKSGVMVDGTLRGNELAVPGSLSIKGLSNTVSRAVRFSDLDRNGHMNNTRYLDWICDLLSARFHLEHPAKAFTICYMSEALEGQQLQLSWSENGVLRVDGDLMQTSVDTGHTRIFSAQVEF